MNTPCGEKINHSPRHDPIDLGSAQERIALTDPILPIFPILLKVFFTTPPISIHMIIIYLNTENLPTTK